MAVSQIQQAPYRQDRKLFPTPLIGDVLFSETRDCNRGNPFPEYGTPHPNAQRWPNHKLVFIKPLDIERNEIFEFFYAADRENQDLYNFSSGYRNVVGNAGGREFRVVQRSYVTPRADFQPLDIPFGTPMPNVPEGKFDDIEYVFFDRQQQPIGEQELNSLYVAEVHTYIEKAFLDYKISYNTLKSDVIPEKFRATIPQTTTEQIVEGLAQQPTLTGSQISVSEDQINPDIKVVKIVSREIPDTNVELIGGRAYVEGGPPADIIETYSTTPIDVDTGVNIVQSTVSPLGDGSFTRETIKVDSWPVLKSSEWDQTLEAQVVRTEQMVPPPTSFDEPNTSFQAVNEDRSLKIVEEAPYEALDSYLMSLPIRTDIQVPPVLKKIVAHWIKDESLSDGDSEGSGVMPAGNGVSLTAEAGSTGQSQYGVVPSIETSAEIVYGSDIPATVYFFYLKSTNRSTSESALISRLSSLIGQSIKRWPIFKPESHTIIARGATVTAKTQANIKQTKVVTLDGEEGSSEAVTEEFTWAINRTIDVVNIANCLHKSLTIQDATKYRSIYASSSSKARLTDDFDGSASKSASATAAVDVSPSSFPATDPPDIPRSGLYIISSKAEPFKWGYVKCSAILLDASQFA